MEGERVIAPQSHPQVPDNEQSEGTVEEIAMCRKERTKGWLAVLGLCNEREIVAEVADTYHRYVRGDSQ